MKKTLLEAEGSIESTKMRGYESCYAPECKLRYIPNAEILKDIEEAKKGISLTTFKNLDDFFNELNFTDLTKDKHCPLCPYATCPYE